MGATTHVVVLGGDEERLHAQARARLRELERKWSRHLARSELSQLNRRAGRLTMVSPETYALVERAVDAWWRTTGRFDPGCSGVRLWPLVEGVTVADGGTLDLTAFARASAADLVATELMSAGAEGVCVNIGGDVRCMGRAPTEDGWVLGVRAPRDEMQPDAVRHEVAHIVLQDGAVATTRYAGGPWSASTVITSEAWKASAVAHALPATPEGDTETLLRAWSATALLFTHAGELVSLSGMEAAPAHQ